jgi:hypothetical protein
MGPIAGHCGKRLRLGCAILVASIAGSAATRSGATTLEPAFQTSQVIDVPAGGSLQQALNQIQPGGTIRLARGAVYTGNFTLPAKNGTDYILITTANASLPAPGVRIDPSYKSQLATIRSASTSSALVTAPGASYYRIVGVAFEANQNGAGDIIALGRADQTTLSAVPHHIELDRVLISGDPNVGQKRAIAANAAYVTIMNSDIREIKAVGQDSQAIGAWNSPGPFVIRNNRLEAAGENILFGGAHISIPGLVPSDILVEGNLMTKDPAWRNLPWTVKNIFELKNAQRVIVRNNTLLYNWGGSQAGFAVVFTPRNSSGQTPWVVISDVEFSGNIVAHSGSAFNLLGHDDTDPTGQLARIVIRNNLVINISGEWKGSGIFAQIGGEPRDITIDHNTVIHTGNVVTFYSGSYVNSSGVRVNAGPVAGFVFTNNLMRHNAYGIFGSGQGYGSTSINYYAPGAIVQKNVLASDSSLASRYPAGNFFPTLAAFAATFRDTSSWDYHLAASSPYVGAGLDGKDLGVDFGTLPSIMPPSPPSLLQVVR